jgi:hypothetical protein
MSSDETDAECTPDGLKRVRRVARVWLSEDISSMWERVERFHLDRAGPRQGNKAFGRIFAPKSGNDAKAIRCLPRNYYSPLWWTSLISVDQHRLSPGDDVALPDCNGYVLFFNFSIRLSDLFTTSLRSTLSNATATSSV